MKESKEIIDLPLNTRNFTQLVQLAPGVLTGVGGASGVLGYTSGRGTNGAVINGAPVEDVTYLIDGINSVDTDAGVLIFFPPVDSIYEFRVQTSSAPAAYGGGQGIINVTYSRNYTQTGALKLVSIHGGTAPNVTPAAASAVLNCSEEMAAEIASMQFPKITISPVDGGVRVDAEGISAHAGTDARTGPDTDAQLSTSATGNTLGGRRRRRRQGLAQYRDQGLPLPERPLLRQDQTGRIHFRSRCDREGHARFARQRLRA
jgi:hypothetical protein